MIATRLTDIQIKLIIITLQGVLLDETFIDILNQELVLPDIFRQFFQGRLRLCAGFTHAPEISDFVSLENIYKLRHTNLSSSRHPPFLSR
jgi:hypothetical protein